MFVRRHLHHLSFLFDTHGGDLVLKTPRLASLLTFVLAMGGELVLLSPGDIEIVDQRLRRLPHYNACQRTEKTVAIHTVHQFVVAQSQTPTSLLQQVRHLTHAFHPGGNDDIGFAQKNRFVSMIDGRQSRSAGLVHSPGG